MRSNTTKLLQTRNTRTSDKKRVRSLNSYQTSVQYSASNSKKSIPFKKAIPHLNIKSLFQQHMKLIQSDSSVSHTQSSISSIRNSQVHKIQKNTDQKYLQQKLQEMRDDKFKYLVFKNKIKRKFHKANTTHGDIKLKQIDRQQIYEPTKSQTLSFNPEYAKSFSTFYSKSRKIVCQEQCPEQVDYGLINKKFQNESDINYLQYVSDKLYRRTFRKSYKSKAFGSSNLDHNKEEKVRSVTEAKKDSKNKSMFDFLQQILHQN